VVLPHFPDQDGRFSEPPNLVGRALALDLIHAAGGDRVAVYGVENPAGTPVYVHAKVCVVDDVWASIGSDNLNRRSWTHDSELAAVVLDETGTDSASAPGAGDDPSASGPQDDRPRAFARDLRLTLAREHLDRADGDVADLLELRSAFDAFAGSARALQAWHDGGRQGSRPPGRLRPLADPHAPSTRTRWARALYRYFYDPDGRPRALRRRHGF
jgi:phosphatidylserine/phosphatidylglycerophosphate/cardiolipin synthase-like enzyme